MAKGAFPLETSKVFYSNNKIVIINDDILTTNAISPNSIDLIVTSPPYNVDIQYNSHQDDIHILIIWSLLAPGYQDVLIF